MLFVFGILNNYAQQDFNVFQKIDKNNPRSPTDNGSINNPWDLQTALTQPGIVV